MDSETQPEVPTRAQVLVIGGGPAGSYAACVLAREGINVVLLEADVFPRYHVGESMLASMRQLLSFIDLDDAFNSYGFTRKNGAAFKIVPGVKREGYTNFLAVGPNNYAWNVVRADADDLIFRHAQASSAKVFDGHKVTTVQFDEPTSTPTSVSWRSQSGAAGSISFDFLIDASGRNGLLSTRYLKTRSYNQGLKNFATWAYWTDTESTYGVGTPRVNLPFFESLRDESGWAWFIPLHNGITSVGVVQSQEVVNRKKKERLMAGSTTAGTAKDFYLEELKQAPSILRLIGDRGTMAAGPGDCEGTASHVKCASDYSYSASSYAGNGYRIVGDAGAFIDPFFSSGVHLAMTGGLTAAASICASIKGSISEEDAGKWHSERVSIAYTRFLLIVLGAYKQMRAQSQSILSSVDEDNFDRAFAFFRPVIQGTADVGADTDQRKSLKEDIEKMVEFCAHACASVQPEDQEAILAKMDSGNSLSLTDEERSVVQFTKVRDTLKISNSMDTANFSTDIVGGLKMRMERGALGLERVRG